MNAFQWFFVTFCAAQLCFTVARFRRSHQLVSLVYAAAWLAGIVVILQPSLSTTLARAIGIGRGADLVLYLLAIVFLWGHYQHYVRYKRVEDHLTTLVRELAIEQARDPAECGPASQDRSGRPHEQRPSS